MTREQRIVSRNKKLTKSTRNDAETLQEWCHRTRNALEQKWRSKERHEGAKNGVEERETH